MLVRKALAGVPDEPTNIGVRRLVTAAIEAHRIDPKLHAVLAEQIPRTGALEDVEVFRSENFDLFRDYLEGDCTFCKPGDSGLA